MWTEIFHQLFSYYCVIYILIIKDSLMSTSDLHLLKKTASSRYTAQKEWLGEFSDWVAKMQGITLEIQYLFHTMILLTTFHRNVHAEMKFKMSISKSIIFSTFKTPTRKSDVGCVHWFWNTGIILKIIWGVPIKFTEFLNKRQPKLQSKVLTFTEVSIYLL